MVLSGIVVDLVHRHSGVDNVGLDGLLLDDGLDVLMHVVVDVLASYRGASALGVLGCSRGSGVLKLGLLALEELLGPRRVVMVVAAVLDTDDVVVVLLWEDLAVLDGLHGRVVMVLMDLTVDGSRYIFLSCGVDGLMLDGRCDVLVYRGVMLPRLVKEV